MKFALPLAQVLATAFFMVWGSATAHAAVTIDAFGPPAQFVNLSFGTAPKGAFVYDDPDAAALAQDTAPFANGPVIASNYNGAPGTNFAIASYGDTLSNGAAYSLAGFESQGFYAGIVSTANAGSSAGVVGSGQNFQRDVLVEMIAPNAGAINFGTGDGTLFSAATNGPTGRVLLQYDGIDASYVAPVPLANDGPEYLNAYFVNATGLGGVDLSQGGTNTGFFFNGVYGNGTIDVTITVWDASGSYTATQAGVYGWQLPGNMPGDAQTFQVLFTEFSGAANFGAITGIDIEFVLSSGDDLTILDQPSGGGIFATNPEPATLAMWSLLGLGGLGMGYFRRRKLAA